MTYIFYIFSSCERPLSIWSL